MSVRERIGDLAYRLTHRMGRDFDDCRTCGRPTRSHKKGNGVQCHRCYTDGKEVILTDGGGKSPTEYDYTNTETGVWDETKFARDQWMGHREKKPYAQWADPHAEIPCSRDEHDGDWTPDCGCDPRYKWGYAGNWRDGHTVLMGTQFNDDVDGLAYIQTPEDPYAYVDGDKVKCPTTGKVHPAFTAIVTHLGATYMDESTSGTGIHAEYRGELPEGVKQAKWIIEDEPWGDNDEPPSIEIYDGKRVCVSTGKHITDSPREIRAWDDETLEAILEANDKFPDPPTSESLDLSDYEPTTTTSNEATGQIKDIYYAIDQLDARDVAEQTIVHRWNDSASTSSGRRAFYPVWGPNSNGTANIVDEDIWQDTGAESGWGGPATMAAIDCGEVSNRNISPTQITGRTWWRAVDHLRDLGFDIPHYDPSDEPSKDHAEYSTVMPENSAFKRLAEGWDWVHAAENEFGDSVVDHAREKTQNTLERCFNGRTHRLVHALPSTGKTTGSVRAAAETDVPVTFLTGRGVDEQYEKVARTCDEYGVSHYTLPALTRDCPCARGDHGEEVRDRVETAHRHGATPKQIHAQYERYYGHPIPCKVDGECPYVAKWDFDPEDYDMLIGHYNHANVPKTTVGRAIAVDEFSGAYLDHWDEVPAGAITLWLRDEDEIPIDDYAELMAVRGGGSPDLDATRADALAYFLDGVEPAPEQAFVPGGHAKAPLLVYTLLACSQNHLGNEFERTTFPGRDDKRIGVYHRDEDEIAVVNPPDWTYARSVTALDGTPTKEMWEDVLGLYLRHERVLTPDEKVEYLCDGLNLNIVRTTDALKPYLSGTYVNVEQDAALMEWIHDNFGEFGLISSQAALEQYDREGLLELTSGERYYGNLLGSNEFENTRVGAVIGSTNYGDDYVKLWGAIHNETVEVNRNLSTGEGFGEDLSYGTYGDKILTHMREHQTLQAVMRFARDGNGGVVFCHTNTLPEWTPHETGTMIKTYSDGQRAVKDAAERYLGGKFSTADVAAEVDLSRRHVFRILKDFHDRGHLNAETTASGFVWSDDGLHRISDDGEVITEVDLDSLSLDESQDISGTTTYSWKVSSTATNAGCGQLRSGFDEDVVETNVRTDDDPPPD